jgi:4-amino-4-deoxychorismate lyase
MSCQLQLDDSSQQAANNRALAYGDGLFETIRICQSNAPLWHYHWRRLGNGASRLNLDLPDEQGLRQAIQTVLDSPAGKRQARPANNHSVARLSAAGAVDGVLKIILYRANPKNSRGYCPPGSDSVCQLQFFPRDSAVNPTTSPDRSQTTGAARGGVYPAAVNAIICQLRLARQPALAGLKHLNRLENVLACAEVQSQAADEGLLFDTSGLLVEATSSNVIVLHGDRMSTPDLSHCGVQGVALAWLQDNFRVKTEHINLDALWQAEAVLLCNSIAGFRTVVQLSDGTKTVVFDRCLQKSAAARRINEIMQSWQKICQANPAERGVF